MEIAFAWLAVALFVVFFAVDVLARGYLHWRSTGSTGTPRRDSGLKATDFAGGAVAFAGMTTTVAGTVLAATDRLHAVRYLDFTGVRVAGTLLAAIGIGAVWVAQSGMGTSWRATIDYTERPELVTTGLFAVIRNPIFTFIIATAAGLALMAPNAVALTGVVAAALGINLHVRRVEEPYLRWAHGDAYVRYAAKVGRFVPGVGRMRMSR
jgi:protein-S-isoprenylcysteine O-methyltransferase Ste14